MGRERFLHSHSQVESRKRSPNRIVQALGDRLRVMGQERTLGNENGHVNLDIFPRDEEIVLFEPGVRVPYTPEDYDYEPAECLDTRVFSDQIARYNEVYNQSVSTEEDPRLKVD